MDLETKSTDLRETTAIVTGASRGFGRGSATALVAAGAHVVGVARTAAQLEQVHADLGDSFTAVVADAADPATANRLIGEYRPRTLVLCAGAAPLMAPIQNQTWESFSANWAVDVAQAFHWTREALRCPLDPGSSVIVFSSGAALNGSPLSGGYAGANATVKFLAGYAAIESERFGLGIDFTSVLPQLTPATELGAKAVAAYAERQGVDIDTFVRSMGSTLTPHQVGTSVVQFATMRQPAHRSYALTSAGPTAIA